MGNTRFFANYRLGAAIFGIFAIVAAAANYFDPDRVFFGYGAALLLLSMAIVVLVVGIIQDKPDELPGYREEFNKNYRTWFWLGIAFMIVSLLLVFFTDDNGGWVGAAMGAVIALIMYFYGLYKYRKDFSGDIRKGNRDAKW